MTKGPVYPKKNLSKIFGPYLHQGDGSRKGVGLGLAICYAIIKKHKGYIVVDSVPNRGTTFHIYLPAYKKEIADMRTEGKIIRHGRGRVLIMDDEGMILNIAKELLQHMGYELQRRKREEAIGFYRQAMS